jgi:hypothetical protein
VAVGAARVLRQVAPAFAAARQIALERPGARLLVGASLDGDPRSVPVDVVASVDLATTRTSLPVVA